MNPFQGQVCLYHVSASVVHAGQVQKVNGDGSVDVVYWTKNPLNQFVANTGNGVAFADITHAFYPFVSNTQS